MQTRIYLPNAAVGTVPNLKYKPYSLGNLEQIPQIWKLSKAQRFAMHIVAQVFPFRTNNYVTNELIDWDNIPEDPIFIINFPQKEMLLPHHFEEMASLVKKDASLHKIQETANRIRFELNPHPAGQMEHNVPSLNGQVLKGLQHKYRETALFFPSQGQTCHAYCTFCFRWSQFVGIEALKFAMREARLLIAYLSQHPEVTDILFTGGDPLVMKAQVMASYIDSLLAADLPNLTTIRIGTKALSYWPYRFLTDDDADEMLALFSRVTKAGKHLALMAHFSHPREMATEAVRQAIARIRETGAQIRTQSPLLTHVNDQPELWAKMWQEQVKLNCVPYYMFVVRDTGAQHYFGMPLVRAWEIFREAYQKVSGVARTVRGPVMSAHPGKVHVLGVNQIAGERVLTLRFLQGRDPDWVLRPFFAAHDPDALWLNELRPAFGETHFFFEQAAHLTQAAPPCSGNGSVSSEGLKDTI